MAWEIIVGGNPEAPPSNPRRSSGSPRLGRSLPAPDIGHSRQAAAPIDDDETRKVDLSGVTSSDGNEINCLDAADNERGGGETPPPFQRRQKMNGSLARSVGGSVDALGASGRQGRGAPPYDRGQGGWVARSEPPPKFLRHSGSPQCLVLHRNRAAMAP
jgi:hypothetical protein